MDMKMLEKLMEKKGKASLDPEYKSAKMDVLKALHGEMGKMMGDDVRGLKKVTVASPDSEGLEQGLEKAKEMLEGGEELDEEMEDEAEMSPEEIDAKIAELQALKAQKAKI